MVPKDTITALSLTVLSGFHGKYRACKSTLVTLSQVTFKDIVQLGVEKTDPASGDSKAMQPEFGTAEADAATGTARTTRMAKNATIENNTGKYGLILRDFMPNLSILYKAASRTAPFLF
jgi:hypothetical protein